MTRHLKLHEKHRTELHASGLSDETIQPAGIYTETNRYKLAALVNYKSWSIKNGSAIVIPFLDEDGERVTVRLKPDIPPRNAATGKARKYIGVKGEPNHAYIPPAAWLAIQDPGARLFITEGEKKALSATQWGFNCISATGVDSWHRKKSFELLPELDRIDWKGRPAYVVFDSDVAENPNVLRSERQLCAALQSHGADVKVIRLLENQGTKVGLDDFLVKNGPGEFERLTQQAIEPEPLAPDELKSDASDSDGSLVAEKILNYYQQRGASRLLFWRDSFWWWRWGRYAELTTQEARSKVLRYMNGRWAFIKPDHIN